MRQTQAVTEGVGARYSSYEFNPSGLNDADRQILLKNIFFAVDDPIVKKYDDAIRVRDFNGGYLMEAAIADGSQLKVNDELVMRAIEKWSKHTGPKQPSGNILPQEIALRLHLGEGMRKALVVARRFNADREPYGEPFIVPALVKVASQTPAAFGRKAKSDMSAGTPNLVAELHEGIAKKRLRRTNSPEWKDDDPYTYGRKLVQTTMVLASIAVADWAVQNKVPLIFSRDPEDKPRGGKRAKYDRLRPNYTAEPTSFSIARRYTGKTEAYYATFTSPLRRPVGLINHIQIGHALAEKPLPFTQEDMERFAWLMNPALSAKAA